MSQDARFTKPASLLHQWLAERVPEEERVWLENKHEEIGGGAAGRVFFLAFSAVPRHLGKADLKLAAEDRQAAGAAREGWQPGRWGVDQAGRALVALDHQRQSLGEEEARRRGGRGDQRDGSEAEGDGDEEPPRAARG